MVVSISSMGCLLGHCGAEDYSFRQPDSHSVEDADKSGFMLAPDQLGRLLVEPVRDSVKGRASHEAACYSVDHLVSGVPNPPLPVIRVGASSRVSTMSIPLAG